MTGAFRQLLAAILSLVLAASMCPSASDAVGNSSFKSPLNSTGLPTANRTHKVSTSRQSQRGWGICFEIDAEPIYKLNEDRSGLVTGTAVLQALQAYRVDVAPPGPDATARSSPLLRIAGYKTWSQLERRSRNVFVVQDGDQARVIPTRYAPARRETAVRTPSPSRASLIRASHPYFGHKQRIRTGFHTAFGTEPFLRMLP